MFGLYFLVKLVRFLKAAGACSSQLAQFGIGLNGIIVYEHTKTSGDEPWFYVIDVAAGTIDKSKVEPLSLSDPRSFLIKDGPCQNSDVLCSVLWVSSPRAGAFQKFKSTATGCRFVLPPWTADELVECWRCGCLPFCVVHNAESEGVLLAAKEAVEALDDDADENAQNEAKLRRWAGDFGPVARRMLDPAEARAHLQGALDELGDEDVRHLSRMAESAEQSHSLLLMLPAEDYSAYCFIPSSVSIGRKILQLQQAAHLQYAESLMGRITGAHLGLVFEPYAHYVLAAGGKWTIRSLAADRRETLQLKPLTTVDITNGDVKNLVIERGKYYVPTDPTYAVVDSWCGSDMFQMTVSQDHPIASGAKQYKALKNKGFRRLIFVVPQALAASFAEQPLVDSKGRRCGGGGGPQGGWNDVAQFVLGL